MLLKNLSLISKLTIFFAKIPDRKNVVKIKVWFNKILDISLNINSLQPKHSLLIAAFFDEENLEFIESQILDFPKNGYNSVNTFVNKITQRLNYPSGILSTNSKNFILRSYIHNEVFSSELESIVILDVANSAKVLSRNFIF